MHRSLGTAALLASALFVASCSDDGDDDLQLDANVPLGAGDVGLRDAGDGMQSVTIRFKAKLGSEDLVCGKAYANQGKSRVSATPQDFRFFVQEVRLVNATGQEVPVEFEERLPFQTKDVALLDFTDGAGDCGGVGGTTTNMAIYGRVPAGTYKGIVFVNGVPESLNHQNPALAPAPLLAPGASWDWLSGYRFVMAEIRPTAPAMQHDAGVADAGAPTGMHMPTVDAGAPTGMHMPTADAGAPPKSHGGGLASTVHVGSTGCSGVVNAFTCTKANRTQIRLTGFDPAVNSVVADLSAIFAMSDLNTPSQCHGTGDACLGGFTALGIDGAGNPAPAQQVFRVE